MGLPVTSLYAALLALLFVALSVRIVRLRGALKIPIGDGGHERLLRAMRAQANFAEYVPLALLISLLIEVASVSAALVHAVCLSLLLGRVVHAIGVSRSPETLAVRVVGMALTFTALGGGAVTLLFVYSTHLLRA